MITPWRNAGLLLISFYLGATRVGSTYQAMDIAAANNEFAFKLLDVLHEDRKSGNVLVSPLGVATCVGMVYMLTNQESGRGIAEIMHFSPDRTQTAQAFRRTLQALGTESFSWATGVFVDGNSELAKTSGDLLVSQMGATTEELDFVRQPEQSRQKINDWASVHTNGTIQQFLPEGTISPETVAVLASAIHFKGEWEVSFDPGRTTQAYFYFPDGSTKTVQMMSIQSDGFGYDTNSLLKAKVLRIPYKEKKQSMVIILPNEKDGLNHVVKQMSRLKFRDEILNKVDTKKDLIVKIPKFTLDDHFNLLQPLKQMGLDTPKSAGATGVYQKTMIVVDEKGTEAAAATGAVVSNSAPPMFVANRPFLFAIVDSNTEAVVFLGIYSAPK